MFKIHLKHN